MPPLTAILRNLLAASLTATLTATLASATPAADVQSRAAPEPATEPVRGATGAALPSLVRSERQMIVTANPHATQAGIAVLRRGGSAADAAVAALLVLNVVEPQSSGLGGGAFALVHGPAGLTSWDARETAPAAAGPELFLEDGAPLAWIEASESGRAIGVPGLARLLEALHRRHGRLSWADLVAPAITLAEEGFPVSPRLAGLVDQLADRLARTEAGARFLPNGRPIAAGTRFVQPELAKTLTRLAVEGADALYDGPVADEILAAVARGPRPGALSATDLAGYEVVERAPVCTVYRAIWRICSMGPPSSGATTVGQILGILGRFKPTDFHRSDPHLWHLFAESSRLAYADRAAYLGDPDTVAVPVTGLLDPDYLAARARLIHGFTASAGPAEAGTPPGAAPRAPQASDTSPGTTHLSVIDAQGLAISLTASIETAFGSGRMAAGLLLNNQLTDFALAPRGPDGGLKANAAGPSKRPRSSMAPTIVYRMGSETPVLLLGSPGGSRIPEYVAGALVGLLDLGLDPAEAAALFHVSHRNRAALVVERDRTPEDLAQALARFGHRVEDAQMASGLAIIRIGPEGIAAAADPRREGTAAGD
ncbi:MAG: gamma-glutamyltransferase [Pikeienuella sp.]